MARILFGEDSKNYVEISKKDKTISLVIASKDPEDKQKTIISSVILSEDEFKELIKDI